MEKHKFVVFGGSFDPFTLVHKAIVTELYESFGAYKVIIAPSFVNWYRKDKEPWMDFWQKQHTIDNMLNYRNFKYDYWFWDGDYQRSLNCKSNAAKAEFNKRGFIDTLLDIKTCVRAGSEADEQEWYFCIGSDQLEFFKNWKMWEEVLSQAKMVVVQGRNGRKVESDIPHIDLWIDDNYQNSSASDVREKYKAEGKTPEDYIDWTYNEFVRDKDVKELLATPIFKVVRGPESDTGLKPILVNAPDWVTIIVEKGDAVLVEQQFRYGAGDYVDEFPCGMVEKDEDPLDAAARELEEETGIRILDKKDFVKLGSTNPNPAFMTNKMHYFYINLDYAKHEIAEQKLDAHEKLEVCWALKDKFIAKLADDAYAENGKAVPAIALSAVKLLERMKSASC